MSKLEEEGGEVFLTSQQVIKLLGISLQSLVRIRKTGKLPTYTRGCNVFFSAEDVKTLLQERTTIIKQPTVGEVHE